MQEDQQYFPAFRKSQLYIKLLAELNLLQSSADKVEDGSSTLTTVSDFSNGRFFSFFKSHFHIVFAVVFSFVRRNAVQN